MRVDVEENLKRMITLADEFFAARTDPEQISVTPRVMKRLKRIHTSTMTEKRTNKGPVAWMLVLPTTRTLMRKFVDGSISERELLRRTPLHRSYKAIYVCSALVLPEYRGRRIATRLLVNAVRSICRDHPIEHLFCWPFSRRGSLLAKTVARAVSLPLLQRTA
jgi:GNAT superfamily N-acetyltransferase